MKRVTILRQFGVWATNLSLNGEKNEKENLMEIQNGSVDAGGSGWCDCRNLGA